MAVNWAYIANRRHPQAGAQLDITDATDWRDI